MLFYADRLEHVEGVIKPALAAGKIVVCDRYFDSTLAYQWGGRHMPKDLLMVLQDQVDLSPHLTLVLDLPPEEGMRRAVERSALDRFEQEAMDFHHRVRQIYLDIAAGEPDRVKCLDVADLAIEAVFERVKGVVDGHLGLS